MISALLLAASTPATAIEAERAFAADAQKIGQWAAFRKWSTADAVMFAPRQVRAHAFLDGKAEPPVAVFWWPGRSYVACDGSHAINSGPWVRDGGKTVGYFTTVWQRQPDGGWKWIYDAGDSLDRMRSEGGDIAPVKASCSSAPAPLKLPDLPAHVSIGGGSSSDGTLAWRWAVQPSGARSFRAFLWTESGWEQVVDDQVAAPAR